MDIWLILGFLAEKFCQMEMTWCQMIWTPLISNWPLVAVSIGGIWVAIRTLKTIEEQTVATRIAAEATKKNADAFVIERRAWVLLAKYGTTAQIQRPVLLALEQVAIEGRGSYCLCSTKNFGKTIATIYKGKFEMQISESRREPPDARVYDTKGAGVFDYRIAPDEETPFEAKLVIAGLRSDQIEKIKKGDGLYLWFCGFLTYDDGFGNERITRFCYIWETFFKTPEPFWRRYGPEKYNDWT